MAGMYDKERATRIGNEIRSRRKQKKLSLRELGQDVGISEQAISQYERGTRQVAMMTLYAIAQALDCSITDLASIDDLNFLRDNVFSSGTVQYRFDNDIQREYDAAIKALRLDSDEDLNTYASPEEASVYCNGYEIARCVNMINKLNRAGRMRVFDYLDDLSGNPKYQREKPQTDDE